MNSKSIISHDSHMTYILVFSGLFQSSTFGFAGILPQKYTAAVMSGQV